MRRVMASLIAVLAIVCVIGVTPVHAISIAVFGNNQTDDFINAQFGAGSATLVSDAQIVGGILAGFDAFYMTRNGFSFGSGLSAAAAAVVAAYVGATGNVVLFNGDFADSLPGAQAPFDAVIQAITVNAVNFAAASGNGYIGEFNGAVSGLTVNSNGFSPIGLIGGSASALACGGPPSGTLVLDPSGVGHPVLAGAGFPFNPGSVECGVASIIGVNPVFVLARWGSLTGTPAIIARGAIPEPATLLLTGAGLAAVAIRRRRRSQRGA